MRVCRRTAALFFPDARLMRQPSPIDVALKVGWSSVFGVGLQQPTFVGSQGDGLFDITYFDITDSDITNLI